MLTYIWNSRGSHRAKIMVLSRKIWRSEYSLVRSAAFNTSVSIVLTVLESQRKCNRNLSVDLTSWGYRKNYSDSKLYFTMVVSTCLKASKYWKPLLMRFWKLGIQPSVEMRSHHFSLSAWSVGLLLVQNQKIHPDIIWKWNQVKLHLGSCAVRSNLKSEYKTERQLDSGVLCLKARACKHRSSLCLLEELYQPMVYYWWYFSPLPDSGEVLYDRWYEI